MTGKKYELSDLFADARRESDAKCGTAAPTTASVERK